MKRSTAIVRVGIVAFWTLTILAIYQLPNRIYSFGEQKTLYILSWPLFLDAQYFVEFEKQTGITLKISYFEHSEELLSKVKATGGAGYDIIFPVDYTVEILIKQGLLQKLDKDKLTFWHDLDTRLLYKYFDPMNDFTIPFYWSAYAIGVNKKLFGDEPPKTWGLIFDKKYNPSHIVMTDGAREAILTAALYLFGSIDPLKEAYAQKLVRDTLLQQKAWVDLYSEERVEELLVSENNMLAFGLSGELSRAMSQNENIKVFIPEQGSFLVIDSAAILKNSKNVDLAYTFINYLYQPDVIDHHVRRYSMSSPIISNKEKSCYSPSDEDFKKLNFLVDIISEDGLNNIWIDLLAN